jgi:hypothetical protein
MAGVVVLALGVVLLKAGTASAHNVTAAPGASCAGWTYVASYNNGGGGGPGDNRLVVVDVTIGGNVIKDYQYFDTLTTHPAPPAGFTVIDHPPLVSFTLFNLSGPVTDFPVAASGSIKIYQTGATGSPSTDAYYNQYLPQYSQDPIPAVPPLPGHCPTSTGTPATATATQTPAPTHTATSTNTPAPATNTPTETASTTPAATSTNTPAPTNTPTNTPIGTATPTNTPISTSTPQTPTNTPISTATHTTTPIATATPLTPTNTPTSTSTPVGDVSATATSVGTSTATAIGTASATATQTPGGVVVASTSTPTTTAPATPLAAVGTSTTVPLVSTVLALIHPPTPPSAAQLPRALPGTGNGPSSPRGGDERFGWAMALTGAAIAVAALAEFRRQRRRTRRV